MKKPQLRFPEFQGDWERKKLKEVSTYFNGGSFENDVKEDGKYELITLKSVDMSGNLAHSKRYLDIKVPTLSKNTLIMILSEQSPGLLGMTALIPTDNKYVLNQRVAEIRPNSNVESYFLSMAINRNQNYFSKHGAGTKVQNISKPNVENYSFLCPSLPEQTKIATFLKAVDEKLQALKKKHSLLEQYKKGVMQKLFSQELRFKDENGNDFPGWEVKKLGEVLTIQGGFAFKSELFKNGNTKVFRIGDIDPNISLQNFTGVYSSETPNEKYLVKKNDFLMALSGATFGKVGKIIDDGFGYINQRVATFRTNECLEFYYQVVQSNEFKNYINSIPTASAQPNISNDDIGNYLTLIPCLQEQIKIAEFLSGIDGKIYKLSLQIQSIEKWKQGLLQKMFC